MRRILILGSTGSIGTTCLNYIRKSNPGFQVVGLTAHKNIEKLNSLSKEFSCPILITDPIESSGLKEFFIKTKPDIVLNAIAGADGLFATVTAIECGIDIALSNKESVVMGGTWIFDAAKENNVRIIPVDSEHSAIFQSLVGEDDNEIEKILLTCSGGPFRQFSHEQLTKVTASDALKHPTWNMGAKITIDSASLMNKGFEVIEAKWLFGVPAEKIQVLIHPQSIVHSAVQFCDGSVKAQLGVPDMRLPIQYAFSFPKRLHLNGKRLDLFQQHLEFFEPDVSKFKCLAMAYEALHKGGNMPCIVNAANEIVNEGFRKGKCSFLQMGDIIERTMQQATFEKHPNYDVYIDTDAEARAIATEIMNKK